MFTILTIIGGITVVHMVSDHLKSKDQAKSSAAMQASLQDLHDKVDSLNKTDAQ